MRIKAILTVRRLNSIGDDLRLRSVRCSSCVGHKLARRLFVEDLHRPTFNGDDVSSNWVNAIGAVHRMEVGQTKRIEVVVNVRYTRGCATNSDKWFVFYDLVSSKTLSTTSKSKRRLKRLQYKCVPKVPDGGYVAVLHAGSAVVHYFPLCPEHHQGQS